MVIEGNITKGKYEIKVCYEGEISTYWVLSEIERKGMIELLKE